MRVNSKGPTAALFYEQCSFECISFADTWLGVNSIYIKAEAT